MNRWSPSRDKPSNDTRLAVAAVQSPCHAAINESEQAAIGSGERSASDQLQIAFIDESETAVASGQLQRLDVNRSRPSERSGPIITEVE